MPIPVTCQCGARFAAKDELAGKTVKCPKCGQPLKIPAAGASPSPAPPAKPKEAQPPPFDPSIASILDEVGMQKAHAHKCPKCGSPMKPEAVLCIQCGYNLKTGRQLETQSDTEAQRRRELEYARQATWSAYESPKTGGRRSRGDSPDSDLEPIEIFVCVCCSGIGCIVGIVYAIQGKPKGIKMIGLSLGFAILWNVLRFAAEVVRVQQGM